MGNPRRRGNRRGQAQSSSKGGGSGIQSQQHPTFLQNPTGSFPPTASGPNLTQRKRMEEIAAAPPHLRQAMLQQLMRERLGVPVAPAPAPVQTPSPPVRTEPPPSLAGLPRSEQQAVVQKLMTHITPQQRHSLFQMSTQHQAAILQRFYVEHVAPKLRSGQYLLTLDPPIQVPQQQQSQPPPLTQVQPQLQVQQQPLLRVINQGQGGSAGALNSGDGGGNGSLMRELLSGLDQSAQTQLTQLPLEQQQAIVIRLLKRHQERWMQQKQEQQQQHQQKPQGPTQQTGSLMQPSRPQAPAPQQAQQAKQPEHQLPYQNSTSAKELLSIFAGAPQGQAMPSTMNTSGLGLGNHNPATGLGVSDGNVPGIGLSEAGLGPLLGGGPAVIQSAAAGELSNDPFALPMGLGSVLGAGDVDDADALRDAMNFFLE